MPVATATKVTRSIPFPIGGRAQYGRKSKRDKYSRSVKHQLKEQRDYYAQEGWPVDPSLIFQDDGISASEFSDEERPGYDKLVAAIRARRVWHVTVTEISRLTRDNAEGLAFADRAREVGSLVVETTNGRRFDLMTNAGRHDFLEEVNKASRESGQTSERVGRNKRESAEEGRYHGGRRPFGRVGAIRDRFDRITNTGDVGVKIVEQEAEVINWWGDMILARWPLLSIVRESKQRGIRSDSGKPFTTSDIRCILERADLIGRRRYMGRLYPEPGQPLAIPPIMSDDKYNKIQARLRSAERLKGANKKGVHTYLLTGDVYCGGCGNKMRGHTRNENDKVLRTYVCRPYDNTSTKVGCTKRRSAEPVELLVEDALLYRLNSPAFTEALRRAYQADTTDDNELARLLEQEQLMQERLYELEDTWTKGTPGLDLNTMLRMKASVENELKQVTAKMARVDAGKTLAVVFSGDIYQTWALADLHQRRMFVDLCIERITVKPHDPKARRPVWRHERSGKSFIFDPELVVIDWKF
jgi:site-specific DNA recombinase